MPSLLIFSPFARARKTVELRYKALHVERYTIKKKEEKRFTHAIKERLSSWRISPRAVKSQRVAGSAPMQRDASAGNAQRIFNVKTCLLPSRDTSYTPTHTHTHTRGVPFTPLARDNRDLNRGGGSETRDAEITTVGGRKDERRLPSVVQLLFGTKAEFADSRVGPVSRRERRSRSRETPCIEDGERRAAGIYRGRGRGRLSRLRRLQRGGSVNLLSSERLARSFARILPRYAHAHARDVTFVRL